MAACKIKEKYGWIKCDRPALEGDPEGLCILHSRQADKDKESRFTEAVKEKLEKEDYDFGWVFFPGLIVIFAVHEFKKDAFFSRATFSGEAYFNMATFSGEARFSWATFSGEADFSWATFSGGADFSGATFSGEADFSRATFEEVDFSRATFQDANFYGATFKEATFHKATFQVAEFSGATFKKVNFSRATLQEVGFSRATFWEVKFIETIIQKADFSWAKINRRVTLEGIQSGEPVEKKLPWWAGYGFIQFGEKGVLRLEDLSLAQVAFRGTDLRRVEFDRVTWGSCWCRAAVYDEVLLHRQRWANIVYVLNYGWLWGKWIPGEWGKWIPGEKEKDRPGKPPFKAFEPVERLYRQLKINYEEERDFKRVGDFHYGEMEMHRRGSPWRQWVPFSWHNLYRVLNGYGERPLRAFIWLLLLIPAWAGLVWGLGINQAGSQTPVNYWDTLLFIFEKATLQRPQWAEPMGFLSKLATSLSVLLLPGQAALFILALRNRLGRRR